MELPIQLPHLGSGLPSGIELVLSNRTTTCSFPDALSHPLYNPAKNDLNPCFLASVVGLFYVVVGAAGLLQLVKLRFFNYVGPYKVKYAFGTPLNTRSTGVAHWFRCGLALAQALLIALLANFGLAPLGLARVSLLIALAVTLFTILPLQYIEPTRSPVGHSSVIWFYFFSFVAFVAVLVSDAASSHKTYLPGGPKADLALAQAAEIALAINSALAFLLEVLYYAPSVELKEYYDLNEWDITTFRNIIQTLSFSFVEPTLKVAHKKNLVELDDVPNTLVDMKAEMALIQFREAWEKELVRARWWRDRRVRRAKEPTKEDHELRPALFIALWRVYWRTVLVAVSGNLVDIVAVTISPFFLQQFILFFTEVSASSTADAGPPIIKGVAFALGIYFLSVLRYISFNQSFIHFFKIGFCIKASLTAICYEKAMKLSPESKKEKSTGDIVNHVSVDINDVANSIETSAEAFTIPLRLVFTLIALYKLLGAAMWAGLGTALVLVPLSSVVSASISGLYTTLMEHTDARTRLTSEILNAIKSIKLYSWEKPMLKKLDEVRNKKELMSLKRMGIYNAGAYFLWGCIPFAISCAVYVFYSLASKKVLVPSVVFPSLALFELLAQPILMLPWIFSSAVEARVALKRLRKFFVLDEMDGDTVQRTYNPSKKGDVTVEAKHANFVWSAHPGAVNEETKYALKDITFTAKKGQLTCVIGRVGSGKTTLLKSIIGEIPMIKDGGSMSANGTIAYCSQSPWILNASVRENILFGRKYDKEYYRKTISACQLESDFLALPNADATLVGEKGISLSGGQKARVSLARAVYARADIYLLDDVLSAVDAHVGKKITNQVLGPKGMLASKTLVLATNSLKILKISHKIIFLRSGEIKESGHYDEMVSNDGEVAKLIEEFGKDDAVEEVEDSSGSPSINLAEDDETLDLNAPVPFEPSAIDDAEDFGSEAPLMKIASRATVGRASMVSYDHVYDFEDEPEYKKDEHEKEVTNSGTVKWSVILEYLKECNWVYVLVWAVLNYFIVFIQIGGNFILKYWSEQNLALGTNTSPSLFLSLYVLTGVVAGIITFVSAYIIWSYSVVTASTNIHDKMAFAVLRSPMSFFDTTPIGRILNRFTDDISALDNDLMWSLTTFFEMASSTLIRLIIVIYNLPLMIIIIGFLVYLYNHFRSKFIPAARELKRLQSALRSPVFSHLQESVNGVETLRAYGEHDRFIHINRRKVDNVTRANWTIQCCNRWLSMRLQSIAAIIVLTSSLLILSSLYFNRGLNPALVGFLMTYVFTSTSSLNGIVRLWAETETKAVYLERLLEYGNLPSEAPLVIDDNRPSAEWPQTGEIKFKEYSTRYREGLDLVLKGISLDINPGEKIGIVGRTGAGKSSLTLALFRMIEAVSGNIDIDLVDTSKIGLFDLRLQLNIIPQDAHAFEGSVRENLDPFQKFTDDELWRVLEMAHLKEHIAQMKTEVKIKDGEKKKKKKNAEEEVPQEGLLAQILEGGSNLSSGQKQLLCMARALLKLTKVLVLDEATAAVDVQTDKIIQETIRSEFKDKTILTIAHRLDTIMDSDRVLVLDKGTVKEFDLPEALLKNKESEFYSLCKEGGYLKD